jgi:fucose permease
MAKTAVMQAPVTHESITEFPMTELPPSETQIDTEQQSTPRSPATIEAEGKLTLHTITKLISSAFAFFVAGTNDGSLGALIPYILSNYSIGTGSIAILYGITFGGWVIAAIIGNIVRAYIGSGGALILGAALQLCAHALRVWVDLPGSSLPD